MEIMIRALNGTAVPGVVVARFGPIMRVAIPGCDDAVEFRLADGTWRSERGEPVQIISHDSAGFFSMSWRSVMELPELPSAHLGGHTPRGCSVNLQTN